MRVLVLSGFYHPITSGAEVFAQKFSAHRAQLGDDVQILTGRWRRDLPKRDTFEGCQITRVPVTDVKNTRVLAYAMSASVLGGKLAHGSDLLHAHMGFPAGFVGAALKKRTGKPLLTTVQGGDLGDYAENTGKVKQMRRLISWGVRHADLIHSVSVDCGRKCRDLGYTGPVDVIPNGVDCSAFRPEARNEDAFKEFGVTERPVILSASRLTPKNGLDHTIKAMPSVLKEFPRAKLVLVGGGEQENELKALVRSLGLEKSVTFTGTQPHTRLPLLTASADIAIRPSLDEGFGISFIESMACGVPTIGTPVGGIKDIIQDGENGVMTKPSDPAAIAESLLRVLRDPHFSRKISQGGIKTAREKYDWPIVFKQMDSLYDRLLGGNK